MPNNSDKVRPIGSPKFKNVQDSSDLSNLVYGKIQPQAVPLEEVVLGAIMIDKDAMPTVMENLKPTSFYTQAHQEIYRAMQTIFQRSHPIDLLTVNDQLKKNGQLEMVGGTAYLISLTNKVASAANIEYHSRIIAQKHIQRELIRASTETINGAYDETIDVFDLLDQAEQHLFEIAEHNINRSTQSLSSLLIVAKDRLQKLSESENLGNLGVPSGFKDLDELTSGFQPSDLIIVAARPGMGKTAFTLALAKNASLEYQKPIAFFSLEMSSDQLTNRLLSMESEVDSKTLRNASMDESEWSRIHDGIEKLADAPIFIDDTPSINIFELRAKCRRLKAQNDIQMVIIDYLQLMSAGGGSSKNGNREQEISTISRSLKALAKELNIPVIALSQLSRKVEERGGDKRPMLSDLRESGAIEQDADIVTFIYRPAYYNITEDENGMPTDDLAEIIFAKHRNGALKNVKLRFIAKLAKFEDYLDYNFIGSGDSGDGFTALPSKMNPNDDLMGNRNLDDDIPF